ncbi:HD-GYP domain-containing protein [Thermodesulfatator indicus]
MKNNDSKEHTKIQEVKKEYLKEQKEIHSYEDEDIDKTEKILQEYLYNEDKKKKLSFSNIKQNFLEQVYEVNKELWLVLSIVSLLAITNFLVDSQRILLNLYSLPAIFSAYFYGKRHAVLTALASILLVIAMLYVIPGIIENESFSWWKEDWRQLTVWASTLLIMAYTMGVLYDRHKEKIKELQKTYHGIILILRHFLSKDEYTENHCYRVSVFATKIAQYMGLSDDRIEDLRSAALIHDIGKLKISREILYKAAKLTQKEFEHMKKHVTSATDILDPIKGSLGRVIPIVLAHHEKYDGTGYLGLEGRQIPIEAKILAVADVYDALISDRPYRKGLPPFEAKEIIVKGAGKHFDPEVVKAFVKAFEHGEMDLPNIMI